MKIALTIHALHGGGAERQLAELANFLLSKGHEVAVITWDRRETDQYEVDSKVVRIGLDLLYPSRNLLEAFFANRRRIRALREALQGFQPQVLVSFTDKMNIVALASKPQMPVIIAERSDPRKQRLSKLWEKWRDRTYPRAAAMVALTEPIAAALRSRFPKNKVLMIPNAVTLPSAIEPTTNWSGDQPTAIPMKRRAIAVGRLSPEKGWDVLLRAWKLAASANSNWELVIVGDGPLRTDLERLISELQIAHCVHMAGWCVDVTPHYRQANLFISSSHYEAMSRSLLEALSHKLPVIVTRATDGLEELVKENYNGWLIPTNDIEVLAKAISTAINAPDELVEYGERSARLVQRHAWEEIGPRWLDLIQSVVTYNRKIS